MRSAALAVLTVAGCISQPDPPTVCLAPRALTELNTVTDHESDPWLSEDRLEILYTTGSPPRIFRATRDDVEAPFSGGELVVDNAVSPHVSRDGKRLWYVKGNGVDPGEIRLATRETRRDPFAGNDPVFAGLGAIDLSLSGTEDTVVYAKPRAPGGLPALFIASVQDGNASDAKELVTGNDADMDGRNRPALTTDGSELRFEHATANGSEIMRASRNGAGFTKAVKVELNNMFDGAPFLHADRRTLVFASKRNQADRDLWIYCE